MFSNSSVNAEKALLNGNSIASCANCTDVFCSSFISSMKVTPLFSYALSNEIYQAFH